MATFPTGMTLQLPNVKGPITVEQITARSNGANSTCPTSI